MYFQFVIFGAKFINVYKIIFICYIQFQYLDFGCITSSVGMLATEVQPASAIDKSSSCLSIDKVLETPAWPS